MYDPYNHATLANCEDPDEMPQNAILHQGLQYLLRQEMFDRDRNIILWSLSVYNWSIKGLKQNNTLINPQKAKQCNTMVKSHKTECTIIKAMFKAQFKPK